MLKRLWLIALCLTDIVLAFIYVHQRWLLTESWWKYYLLVSGLIGSLSAVIGQRAIFSWFRPIVMGAEYSPQKLRARTVNERIQHLLNLKWSPLVGSALLLPIAITLVAPVAATAVLRTVGPDLRGSGRTISVFS